MADSQSLSKRSEELDTELKTILENSKVINGNTKKYVLSPTVLSDGDLLRRERIGQKNEDKPHKVILMVGETGTGKTTLINSMINYIMGVKWEDKIWLEAIEISEHQTESQTKAVTVYEVYAPNSPFALTVIDTPGFGDTEGFNKDQRVAEALQQLFRSEDGIHEIHAVCLVLNASDVRLHERKRYILDEILSLFGKDIEKHILLLFTHQEKPTLPKRITNFIKESLSKYTKNGEYICFKFDNCQSECSEEEDRESYKVSWDNGIDNFRKFFNHLNEIKPKSLHLTEGVLTARKQLDASVSNLRDRIELADLKEKELEQTKTALDKCENYSKEQNNFQFEVDEPYKDLVPINASWWHLSKEATHCTTCKENCHYPGCWWVSNLSNCSVMEEGKCKICKGKCDYTDHVKDKKKCKICKGKCDYTDHVKDKNKCTICTGKCYYTDHVKDNNMYVIKTRKVKKTKDDLKKKYDEETGEKKDLMTKLEKHIKQIEAEKIELVKECYECLEKIMETALKSTSMSSFIHLDFIIEKVKETGNQERAQKLEELKIRVIEDNKGLAERFYTYTKQMII
ncbi:hypothetical protein R3I94_023292 [Phoxinus phoxinus]|uniref:AAA+ ATPase domain-containing protein n=1 Tax=Phoxinus phoxinus TaxID=58324 RepID=A0AAN9HJZ1_9TELE